MCWEGDGVVKTGRVMLGETNPRDSKPGTIRGDYCIQVGGLDQIDLSFTAHMMEMIIEELNNIYFNCRLDGTSATALTRWTPRITRLVSGSERKISVTGSRLPTPGLTRETSCDS